MKYDEFIFCDRFSSSHMIVLPPGSQIYLHTDQDGNYPPLNGKSIGWSSLCADGIPVGGAVIDDINTYTDWATCRIRIPALDQPAEPVDEAVEDPENFDHEPASFEEHARILLKVANMVLRDGVDKHRVALTRAIGDVAEWYEHVDDPRANGWVGDNGLP